MAELVFAGVLFIGTHLGISSTGLRPWLIDKVGQGAYLVLFSAIAFVTIGYLVATYLDTPQFDYLWGPSRAQHWAAFVVMPVAFVLLIGGLIAQRSNPTSIGGDAGAKVEPTHFLRITRHPFQWSVVLWAAAHVIANGDLASIVFFASLGVVSIAGTALIDRKKAAQLGDDWQLFAARTSNLPFAAIAQGRNRFVPRELVASTAAGIVVYVLVLVFHEWLSGVAIL